MCWTAQDQDEDEFLRVVWWTMHGQYLVNTMAWKGSADVVGLLADRTSYGVYGDHGGAQRSVQRIPMIVYNPSIRHMVSPYGMKLADITPTVLSALGITPTAPLDGRAVWLPCLHDTAATALRSRPT